MNFWSKTLLLIFIVLFVVNIILLFFSDGPLWVSLCFTLFLLVLFGLWILVAVYANKKIRDALLLLLILNMVFVGFVLSISVRGPQSFLSWWSGFSSILYYFICICFVAYFGFLFYKIIMKKKGKKLELPRKISWLIRIRKPLRITCLVLFTVTLAFFLFLQALLLFPLVYSPVMTWKADTNKTVVQELAKEITLNCSSDLEKTKTLLNWFERYSGNMFNLWGYPTFGEQARFGFTKDYSSCFFCMRTGMREPPLWVLTSRCGACEEHSLLFREMANAINLTTRSVLCHEMDHLWDEVLINGSWVIVDPANVIAEENMSGFNLSVESFQQHFPSSKNVSYVFAEYSNGSTEDVTSRYNNRLVTINISTVDQDMNPIPSTKVTVFSNNRYQKQDIELDFTTDEKGQYQLTVGEGSLIFVGKDNSFIPLYGEEACAFASNQSYCLTIMMKSDWTKNEVLFYGVIISTIVVGLSIFVYYRKRKKNAL